MPPVPLFCHRGASSGWQLPSAVSSRLLSPWDSGSVLLVYLVSCALSVAMREPPISSAVSRGHGSRMGES